MKKNFILTTLLICSSVSLANNKKEHRQHEAHVHGGATLSMAFDQLKGRVEFKAASEGILGFEHEAKSDTDKKKLNETIVKFETSIASMVKFEDSVECRFTKEKIEMAFEKEGHGQNENEHKNHSSNHSDFIAYFSVECKKDIKGTKITFDFSQFKGLKDLDVTLLVGDLQKSVEVKKKPVTVDLK